MKGLKKTSATKLSEFMLSYNKMCNVEKMLIDMQKLPLEVPYYILLLEVKKVINLFYIRNNICSAVLSFTTENIVRYVTAVASYFSICRVENKNSFKEMDTQFCVKIHFPLLYLV